MKSERRLGTNVLRDREQKYFHRNDSGLERYTEDAYKVYYPIFINIFASDNEIDLTRR